MTPTGRLPVEALQSALAAEHAAVWAYGLTSAFLADELASQLAEAAAAHRARRDGAEQMLVDAGALPVPAEPGYLTPEPITDNASALRLAITVETDTAAAWRSVIERSPAESGLRQAALDALIAAAVQAAHWRTTAHSAPATVPFPGAP